jgi:hypothetical protein
MGKYIAASNTKILENSHFDTVVVHRNVKLGRTRREERTHKADLVHLYREKKGHWIRITISHWTTNGLKADLPKWRVDIVTPRVWEKDDVYSKGALFV